MKPLRGTLRFLRGGAAAAALFLLVSLTTVSCAPDPDLSLAERFDPIRTGPTQLSRTAGGYELKNRLVRVVIDEASGDVVYWGSTDGSQSLLGDVGSASALRGVGGASSGYVEKRDDQTWQYIGEGDAGQVGWRKVFCLDGRSLLATYIVQNLSQNRLDGLVAVRIPLADQTTTRIAQPDLYELQTPLGRGVLRGFRERPYDQYFDDPPATLLSDSFQLRPAERFSFTTEWRLEPSLEDDRR